jgi:hypothetical protein
VAYEPRNAVQSEYPYANSKGEILAMILANTVTAALRFAEDVERGAEIAQDAIMKLEGAKMLNERGHSAAPAYGSLLVTPTGDSYRCL